MEWRCLLLLAIISVKAEAHFLFQHEEGDGCLMRSGTLGTCQRSCGSSSTSGARDRCGIKDSTFLVCCDRTPEGDAIVLPGQMDPVEGDTCITHSGRSGRCSRSCQHSSGLAVPRRCGIQGSGFLVCCDRILGSGPRRFTDTAPPSVTFRCGRNARSRFSHLGYDQGGVLRPEAAAPPFILIRVEENRRFQRNVPGLPPGQENVFEAFYNSRPPEDFLVGAVNAERNAWPWMALIGERTDGWIVWFCGGVLISEQWVLTARHCVLHKTADLVRLGEHNYNDDTDGAAHEDFNVTETVLYPGYTHPQAYHDLALLRLASKVALREFVSPVCLPWGAERDTNITGQKATLAGWGDTEFRGSPSSILQEVNVTVFPAAQCDSSYSGLPHYPNTWPRGIGQETLCAGDPAGGRDACQGDSGGPLVSQDARKLFVLAGIVSRGYGCGHKDYPGLYANLRYPPYLAWIKKVAFATP